MGEPPVTAVGSIPTLPTPRNPGPSPERPTPFARGTDEPKPSLARRRAWAGVVDESFLTEFPERMNARVRPWAPRDPRDPVGVQGTPWRSHPRTPPFPFDSRLERGSGPRRGRTVPPEAPADRTCRGEPSSPAPRPRVGDEGRGRRRFSRTAPKGRLGPASRRPFPPRASPRRATEAETRRGHAPEGPQAPEGG